MNKTKKKVLGIFGLFAVVAMTLIAAAIPVPTADAVGTTSVTNTIQVIVHSQYPNVTFLTPASGSVSADPNVEVSFSYENAVSVDLTLNWVDDTDTAHSAALPRIYPEASTIDAELGIGYGTATVNIDLNNFGGYQKYTLTATINGAGAYDEDSIIFYYAALSGTYVGTATNNDPIISVKNDDGVASYTIQAYDSLNNPIFDEPISYTVPSAASSEHEFTLPFASYGLPDGSYTIVFTAFDDNDDEIPLSLATILHIDYARPIVPNVPDTGEFLAVLNISRADYLISGLIIFFVSAIIALYLLKRDRKSSRRR